MATFQGFELISNFSGIFTFLFTFSVVYGVLAVSNVFKENGKTLNPILALSISMIASFSGAFVSIVSLMSPWLITIIISLFFIILFLRFLGVSDELTAGFFSGGAKEKKTVIYWVIVVVLVIVVLAISLQVGDQVGPYVGAGDGNTSSDPGTTTPSTNPPTGAGDSFAENLGATLFHPNVVGAFLIMLFASLAIRQLSQAD